MGTIESPFTPRTSPCLGAMAPYEPRTSIFALAGDQEIKFAGQRQRFSDCDFRAFCGAVANEPVGGRVLVVERDQPLRKVRSRGALRRSSMAFPFRRR